MSPNKTCKSLPNHCSWKKENAIVDDQKTPLSRYVFELTEPESGELQLGCENEHELVDWMDAFRRAADEFNASVAAEEALKKAKDLMLLKRSPK